MLWCMLNFNFFSYSDDWDSSLHSQKYKFEVRYVWFYCCSFRLLVKVYLHTAISIVCSFSTFKIFHNEESHSFCFQ